MVAAQLLTLAGVALGAIASYLVSSLNERARHRREVAHGWEVPGGHVPRRIPPLPSLDELGEEE